MLAHTDARRSFSHFLYKEDFLNADDIIWNVSLV